MSNQWVPEICYEESEGGLTSKIPFIHVPDDQAMPRMLFIFESHDTGEYEPGLEGEEIPVVELNLHQYANMSALKNGLSPEEYDRVRFVLGLDPMKDAVRAGQKITENIRQHLGPSLDDAND
ncbi:MAG: hypothetical protein CML56_00915 [Rhodobacteraceae bacterium]|nr:hypothetical protein [Paracoccaceae bacterium]